MSRTSRATLLGAALAACSALAAARGDLFGLDPQVQTRLLAGATASGNGSGLVRLPSAFSLGEACATLHDANGQPGFEISAYLTLTVPHFVDRPAHPGPPPPEPLASGLLLGLLHQVVGEGEAAQLVEVGHFEGRWSVGADSRGELEALVYRRGKHGDLLLAGLLAGSLDMDAFAEPAPSIEPVHVRHAIDPDALGHPGILLEPARLGALELRYLLAL